MRIKDLFFLQFFLQSDDCIDTQALQWMLQNYTCRQRPKYTWKRESEKEI